MRAFLCLVPFYVSIDPQHYMSVPGVGYGNTVAKFAAPFVNKIRLNSRVTEINYSDPNGVIISYTKNGVDRMVKAKTVLVTVSLGVLKAGNIKFTPSLPEQKQEVINGMGNCPTSCLMYLESF